MKEQKRKLITVPVVGTMHKVCGVCSGSGQQKCPRCDGYGTFEDGSTCYYCNGAKTITCNVCKGYGYYD